MLFFRGAPDDREGATPSAPVGVTVDDEMVRFCRDWLAFWILYMKIWYVLIDQQRHDITTGRYKIRTLASLPNEAETFPHASHTSRHESRGILDNVGIDLHVELRYETPHCLVRQRTTVGRLEGDVVLARVKELVNSHFYI